MMTLETDLASTASGKGAGMIGFAQDSVYSAETVGSHLQRFVCVTDAPFNATLDGTTDDTAALQAAVTAVCATGGTLWIPAGIAQISDEISIGAAIRIVGSGLGTAIRTNNATANILNISGPMFEPGVQIEQIHFTSSVNKTDGRHIYVNGTSGTKIRNCLFDKAVNAITVDGGVSQGLLVQGCFFFGISNICVDIIASTDAQGIVVSRILDNDFFGASEVEQTAVAIRIDCVGDLTIRGNHTLYCSTGISLTASSGKTIQAIKIIDNWLDSGSNHGLAIVPSGGTIYMAKICNNWIATFGLNGLLGDGSGTCGTVEIVDNIIGNNSGNGIAIGSTIFSEVDIRGNKVGGNLSSGCNIAANLHKFKVIANTFGVAGQWGDNGGYDVIVNVGNSDGYIITQNFFTTGGLGSLSDGGGGTNKITGGNIVL